MKKVLSLVAAIAFAVSLTACGGSGLTAMDATHYVRGILDLTYFGDLDKDYMESVDIDEAEAQATYEDGLEVEYEYFAYYFDMNMDYLTEETRDAILDLLADIYLHSKYQVKTATKVEGGFVVEVVVEPIDIIPLVTENYMQAYGDEFAARYADVDWNAISAEEEEAFWITYENDWALGVVALFREHETELGYLEAESIMVQVKPDEEGIYYLSDSDFSNVDALILAYNYR